MIIVSTVTFGAPRLYRVKHDFELPTGLRAAVPCPEVYVLNGDTTPFGRDWQLLSFALNPGMTGAHWRSLYQFDRAFTNGNGFNDATDPRADYVTGRDLDCPLPKWDKTRVCGGAEITGREDGTDLIVDILDGFGPAPSLEWLLAHPQFYFKAVIVTANGIINFPQMGGLPVYVPLVGSGVARYPLANLERVG